MGDSAERETAAWTVLVYMAGDNNLTEEMAWGLQELKKTAARLEARPGLAPQDRINVVAHFDPRGSRSRRYDFVPRSVFNGIAPEPCRDGDLHLYEAMIHTRRSVATRTPGNGPRAATGASLDSPLRDFVTEQVDRLPPAKRFFLILAGHGSGAVGDFLIDSDPRTALSIPELALILGDARKAYALSPIAEGQGERRIDILGMDSCLMSTAEVCFEIREDADYLVASEGWVANAGWPYHRVLEACLEPESDRADQKPGEVAERVAINYASFYQDYEIAGMSTDVAVCRLEAFRAQDEGSLVGRLQALSRACAEAFDTVLVRDVLSRTAIEDDKAKDLVGELCAEIAALVTDTDDERASLISRLVNGSELAREQVKQVPELGNSMSASQRKAVTELVEAHGRLLGLSDQDLEKEITKSWHALADVFTTPQPSSVALAAVRLLREFDPGILEALGLIEAQQREGRPGAKQARAILQKLHQVRWLRELRAVVGELKGGHDDVQLLNAVVASRWRAQSFKGGVYVDLFDLCRCLVDRLDGHRAAEVCEGVGAAALGAVPISRRTGAASQHAHGLSVYFPCHTADYAPAYDNLEFAKKTGWGRLVRAYLRATRRDRRDEEQKWANAADHVLRFGQSEVDPLEADGIEARIVGVIAPTTNEPTRTTREVAGAAHNGKVRLGTETKIRLGTETKIRAGTEAKIRGEGGFFEWGNPPDGFFRQAEDRKQRGEETKHA
jgi:Clostripain family